MIHLVNGKGSKAVLLVVAVLLFSALGCLDEIDLPTSKSVQNGIVIEGSLRDGDPAVISVNISRIFDFTANISKPVNVREVSVINDAGQSAVLPEESLGYYELILPKGDSDFLVEVGRTYQLRVLTFDGQEIVSNPELLISVSEAGPVDVGIVEKTKEDLLGEFVTEEYLSYSMEVPVELSSEGKAGRFLWDMTATWKLTDTPLNPMTEAKTCYITDVVNRDHIAAFDGNEVSDVNRISVPIYESPKDYHYAEGLYLTIYQQSLTEEAFRYWNEISQVIDRTGNMFESPAGRIRSNFEKVVDNGERNEVFGYFYATQVDTSYFYVSPEIADNPTALCPWPPGTMSPPGRECPLVPCCDCLVADNSQLEKPSFWVE